MMKGLIFAALVLAAGCRSKKGDEGEPVDANATANAGMTCTHLAAIVNKVVVESKLGDEKAQTCSADSDCVSSPPIITCSDLQCSVGCMDARNKEQHERAQGIERNEQYKSVSQVLHSRDNICPYLVPGCVKTSTIYCDQETKLCKMSF